MEEFKQFLANKEMPCKLKEILEEKNCLNEWETSNNNNENNHSTKVKISVTITSFK